MIAVDWVSFGFGALTGALASALFFAGLALGMRIALRSGRTTPVLLVSAAVRIAALLSAGFLVAGQGAWALAGYALTFLLIRSVVLNVARRPSPEERQPCN